MQAMRETAHSFRKSTAQRPLPLPQKSSLHLFFSQNDVRKATQSEFGITLAQDEPIDAAAAKLYDGVYLWAKSLNRVLSNNGAPLPGWTRR